MAGLKTDANGNKLVTFRYGGKQFTKSAGTKDHRIAGAIKSRVETTIFQLTQGFIELPDGADPGEFIVTGGKRVREAGPRRPPRRASRSATSSASMTNISRPVPRRGRRWRWKGSTGTTC